MRRHHLPHIHVKYQNQEYSEGVAADLAGVRAYDRRRILDSIESQLAFEPARQTRNRKPLVGLVPLWEHIEPVWELRVGGYRVFYDVHVEAELVLIRAIRRKPPHKTTEGLI